MTSTLCLAESHLFSSRFGYSLFHNIAHQDKPAMLGVKTLRGSQARYLTTTSISRASQSKSKPKSKSAPRPSPIVIPAANVVPDVDSSYVLDQMDVGMRQRGVGGSPVEESEPHVTPPSPPTSADPAEPTAEDNRRPERRAPATVFGAKSIGQVQLPPKLVEAVTEAVTGENGELPTDHSR